MKIHEYQAKEILKKYGMPVPNGMALLSPADVPGVAAQLTAGAWIVKAQVHTGGRGKAGGILKITSANELAGAAQTLFGKTLVTHQTGPSGVVVRKLYVEQAQSVAQELYLACVLDRSRGCPVLMISREGGMDIEELARTRPEAITFQPVDPVEGLTADQARAAIQSLGLAPAAIESVAAAAQAIFLRCVSSLRDGCFT